MLKVTRWCLRALDMEKALVLVSGPSAGSSLSLCKASDGHVPHLLGCSHEWSPCLRSVEWPPSDMAYLLPEDAGRASCTTLLSPRSKRSPCVHVSYINHQRALRSHHLYKLAYQNLVWSQGKVLSLRAVHIPGHQVLAGAEAEAWGMVASHRGNETELESFGQAQVDLLVTRETSHCSFWFSLTNPAPVGICHGRGFICKLSLIALFPGVKERVHWDGVWLLLEAPFWPGRA